VQSVRIRDPELGCEIRDDGGVDEPEHVPGLQLSYFWNNEVGCGAVSAAGTKVERDKNMKAIIAIITMLVAGVCAAQEFVQLPWLGTNYSRTNLTVWWSDGTNYDGVSPWRLSQAVNENFNRLGDTNTALGALRIQGIVKTIPRTITNATDTSWGYGAGLMCCDSNYVYVSVATNLWKRAALSAW
jgi:hypothetical protein